MSVVVKNYQENIFRLHVKGSPEKIKLVSDPKSLPRDYDDILNYYS